MGQPKLREADVEFVLLFLPLKVGWNSEGLHEKRDTLIHEGCGHVSPDEAAETSEAPQQSQLKLSIGMQTG